MYYAPVIRSTVRFSSEALARSYIQLLVPLKSYRVADYGVDLEGHPAEPFWLAIDQLTGWEAYTPAQLQRWKASGHLSH